ncbi:MAG: prolipoprotein diacylglyceryl transferase [Verrucomicrobiales bacterium]|nr:prolipoprotein diacylglyceryl transferase [Verrucomicrobiales bacterium]
MITGYYLHHLDPVLIQFTEKLAIRWYGLAYVLSFVLAFLLLRQLVRKGYSELKEDQVADFITFSALFGVMLGGRLGYMLLYDFDRFIHAPWIFFYFLNGGMASHGGILGLVMFTWFYAWRNKISWLGVGDNLVVVAPIGLFLVRIANFINGELYGRVTSVAWAMKFPGEMYEMAPARLQQILAKTGMSHPEMVIVANREGNEQVQAVLQEFLQPRHPSQFYEAGLEGLLLFSILLMVRLRWKNLYHGILTGLFFILYAVFRIGAENFREPDAALILGLPRGQFYSLFMVLIGCAFMIAGFKNKRSNRPEPESSKRTS